MAKRIWLLCAAFAVVGVAPPMIFAKPGDLPVDIKQQCPDARDPVGDGWTAPADTGGLAARPWAGADAPHRDLSAQPTERDPEARPVNRLRDAHHRVRRPVHVPVVDPYEAEASRLFALGERCRQIGDYGQARVCFEEAHLVSPTSVAGRLAIDRLREMRRERFGGPPGAAEEAETFGPSYSTRPRIAAPQRPAVEPRDRAMPRRSTSQPGTSPARQPQLPPLPTPSIPSDLHRLKEMMDSTVPLGGAEEQEVDRREAPRCEPSFVELTKEMAQLGRDIGDLDKLSRNLCVGGRRADPRPFLPFMAWTRAELVADWATAHVYARSRVVSVRNRAATFGYYVPDEPGDCDAQAAKDSWSNGAATVVFWEGGLRIGAPPMPPAVSETDPFRLLPLFRDRDRSVID